MTFVLVYPCGMDLPAFEAHTATQLLAGVLERWDGTPAVLAVLVEHQVLRVADVSYLYCPDDVGARCLEWFRLAQLTENTYRTIAAGMQEKDSVKTRDRR